MGDAFPKVSFLRNGYVSGHMDAFFEDARRAYKGGVPVERFSSKQVRQATFLLKRGGYRMDAVDAAMNRLEAAFARRDCLDHAAVNGKMAWPKKITDRATTLYDRLLRPHSERFAHPQKGRSYDIVAVGDLLDRLAAYFDKGGPLSVDEVCTAVFKPARGKEGYLEGSVDTYLRQAVGALLVVE